MQQATQKNLLILLQVLLLLALLYWIVWLGKLDQQSAQARVLMDKADVQSILITRPDMQMQFERDGPGWRMVKPIDQAANDQRLLPILSLLTLPSSHRYELQDIDATELGLNPPQASVTMGRLSFLFGSTDASGHKRYLQANEGVYLVDDLIFPLLNSAAESFAAPTVAD